MTSPDRKPLPRRFNLAGVPIGIGIGTALCVSSGPTVGIPVGIALAIIFALTLPRKD